MGTIFFDYDNDGDQDLYLTHDTNQANIFYENDGTGKFTDVSAATQTNLAAHGMGVDIGDFNQDGWMDVYVTNLFHNFLLKNNGDGTFSNIASSAYVNDYGMSWSTTFMDYDNDGWTDIFMVNDFHFSPYANRLYQNKGDETFKVVSNGTVLQGFTSGFGGACADINNDGWLDIMVANNLEGEGDQLFLNNGTEDDNHYVAFKLTGVESNRFGVGARIELSYGNGKKQYDQVTAGNGFASQNSLIQHFGVGEYRWIESVIIRWPSGQVDELSGLLADSVYEVTEGQPFIVTGFDTNNAEKLSSILLSPNPTSKSLNISFQLKESSQVKVWLSDLMGREVQLLSAQLFLAKAHQIHWDLKRQNGTAIPKGIYLVFFELEGKVFSKRLVVE